MNVVVIQIRYSSIERACCSDPVGEYPLESTNKQVSSVKLCCVDPSHHYTTTSILGTIIVLRYVYAPHYEENSAMCLAETHLQSLALFSNNLVWGMAYQISSVASDTSHIVHS